MDGAERRRLASTARGHRDAVDLVESTIDGRLARDEREYAVPDPPKAAMSDLRQRAHSKAVDEGVIDRLTWRGAAASAFAGCRGSRVRRAPSPAARIEDDARAGSGVRAGVFAPCAQAMHFQTTRRPRAPRAVRCPSRRCYTSRRRFSHFISPRKTERRRTRVRFRALHHACEATTAAERSGEQKARSLRWTPR